MKRTIILEDYSTISEKLVLISGSSTTYAHHSLLELPSLDTIKKNHSDIGRIAKEKGIKLIRKHKTLANAKRLEAEAQSEYSVFCSLFNEYREFWSEKTKDGTLSYNENSELQEGYDLSQKLSEMLYRSTKLYQFVDAANWIKNALQHVVDEDKERQALTVYL